MLAEVGASVGPMLVQAMVLMSPVVFVVVLMNIGTGILNRLAPQMNMFSIGTPLALLIGGAALVVFMPDMSVKLVALVNDALTATDALLSTHPVK
jgi:flagellar biosynthetic protein FliR